MGLLNGINPEIRKGKEKGERYNVPESKETRLLLE